MQRMLIRAVAVAVVLSPVAVFAQVIGKPVVATYITKEDVDLVNTTGQGTDRNIAVVNIGHENFSVGIIHRGPTNAPAAAAAGGNAARGAAAAAGRGAAGGAAAGRGAGGGAAAGRGGGAAGGGTAAAATPAGFQATCGLQMANPPAGGTTGLIFHDNQTEGYLIVSGGGALMTGGYIVNGRHSVSADLNGPTCGGTTYGEVVKKVVKTGDIIIIPAGVPHGWTDIGDHVDYLSFRPSPNILTAGFVHPVLRK